MLLLIILHQHSLMVKVASFSNSDQMQAKSAHTSFKTGPPSKKSKLAAVSTAKAKNMKQQDIKKYVQTGNYFFC